MGRAPAGLRRAPGRGRPWTWRELKAYLGERVARWQLPERWAVVDAVPRTSVGKFDKKVLRQQHTEGGLAVESVG